MVCVRMKTICKNEISSFVDGNFQKKMIEQLLRQVNLMNTRNSQHLSKYSNPIDESSLSQIAAEGESSSM